MRIFLAVLVSLFLLACLGPKRTDGFGTSPQKDGGSGKPGDRSDGYGTSPN